MAEIKENKNVRQRPEEGYRRWFVNEFFDLIVWYESAGRPPAGFQLCYNRHVDERAFTWHKNKRSTHFVSAGADERGVPGIATAILHGDPGPVPEEVLDRLHTDRGEIDDTLLELVVQQISSYNASR